MPSSTVPHTSPSLLTTMHNTILPTFNASSTPSTAIPKSTSPVSRPSQRLGSPSGPMLTTILNTITGRAAPISAASKSPYASTSASLPSTPALDWEHPTFRAGKRRSSSTKHPATDSTSTITPSKFAPFPTSRPPDAASSATNGCGGARVPSSTCSIPHPWPSSASSTPQRPSGSPRP